MRRQTDCENTGSVLAQKKAHGSDSRAADFCTTSTYDLCFQALPTPAFKRKETDVKELEGHAMLALGL